MYPSGVGNSYADPRRSNYTKSQSMHFQAGQGMMKDFSETTANSNPMPRDALGSNLRRGRGLSFSKGIAQFDGFNGARDAPRLSRPAQAAADEAPNYDAYMNYNRASSHYSSASGQYLESGGSVAGSSYPNSAREREGDFVARADDDRSQQSRPSSSRYVSSSKSGFRPLSAPAQRSTDRGELPSWAVPDHIMPPSFDKTVENSKSRPGSARIRPQSGLPLSYVPKWISQDKKVLSFEAFFKEAVQESRIEHYRVRRCVVQYFLEDDTLKISEPREENSGIPQGSFLKRHKVHKEDGSGVLTWRDLKIPGDLTLYGRTFRITKCDDFTASFFRSRGFTIDSEEHVPMDPMRVTRSRPSSAVSSVSIGRDGEPSNFHGRLKNDMSEYIEARLGRCQDKKALVTKYLANDRKVLRFYATWNDKDPDGCVQRRPFILHFFLADDTVEILEVKETNSGRDPFPALLKRMKLPKGFKGMSTVGGGGAKDFYSPADLSVGGVVTVFGRQLVLDDCDETTRAYYEEEFGVRFPEGGGYKGKQAPQRRPIVVPPHNGFGKEEDSRQNCVSLHPKPPKVNVIRLLENKGKMLRFVGKLENAVGFDVERVFTITYFLDTDEISIFEPAVKNSGRTGGKFMERCRVRKPRSSDYYTENDLFLGARIIVYSRRFVLVDADEFSVKYMEAHCHDFPFSNVGAVLCKLQSADRDALACTLRARDATGTGRLPADSFKEAMVRSGSGLNDQEAHTLARHLAVGGVVEYERLLNQNGVPPANGGAPADPSAPSEQPVATFDEANARLRTLLYRRGPSGVRGLERAMLHISRGAGSVGRDEFDAVLGFCGVSLTGPQAQAVFERYDRGEGVIEARDIIAGLRAPLSRGAERAVLAVFETLEDPTFKTGAVEQGEVLKRYKPGRHPKVTNGDISEVEALRELEDSLEGTQGVVMAKDLLSFYADVVAGYKLSEQQLMDMLRATWGLGGRR